MKFFNQQALPGKSYLIIIKKKTMVPAKSKYIIYQNNKERLENVKREDRVHLIGAFPDENSWTRGSFLCPQTVGSTLHQMLTRAYVQPCLSLKLRRNFKTVIIGCYVLFFFSSKVFLKSFRSLRVTRKN